MSLLCTTRFDPILETFDWNNAPDGTPSPYLLLAYQFDRLVSSAARLGHWIVPDSFNYTTFRHICDEAVRKVNGTDGRDPLRIRVIYPQSGDITASASPVQPLGYDPTAASCFTPDVDTHPQSVPILSLCIDTQPTSGTVTMKTTNRKAYNDARARASIPPLGAPRGILQNYPDDVILFNSSGAIMETSICNVAFYRNGKWLTPPLTVGCVSGVFRRWLLENSRIYEHTMSFDAIKDNEWVLVFNGVMGCRLGRVRRDRGADTRVGSIRYSMAHTPCRL